ncbi:MAG: hypothetical protein DWP92_04190 [Armatimonadetes bacterium]|nr:MAG: hypothetical protein DWP92_04190 [Armatimonadota bacterium]
MTAFYGIILLIGVSLMLAWLVLTAIASSVEGWGRVDPERRWGVRGRCTVAGLLGFGMAGISVLYTTAPEALSIAAAVVGGLALIAVARWVVPPTEQ